MVKKLAVVVPVANQERFSLMLDSLNCNSVLPDKVLIFDNTETGIIYAPVPSFEVIRGVKPHSVNESWNMARQMTQDFDYISFLNDDVILNDRFFERIIAGFSECGHNCGVICPSTISRNMDEYKKVKHHQNSCFVKMHQREGWAFTIKRSALDSTPMIPALEMPTFCGDDWLYHFTHAAGYYWYKDMHNIIFHAVGQSTKLLGVRGNLNEEKKKCERLIREYSR